MKNIKLFEAFDRDRDEYWDDYLSNLNSNLKKSREESKKNWDDYYHLIDQEEALKKNEDVIDFEQDEIDKIRSLFSIVYKVRVIQVYDGIRYISCERSGFIYRIYRMCDEWYLVSMEDPYLRDNGVKIYYLCDQFDGLKALIDKTTIKR